MLQPLQAANPTAQLAELGAEIEPAVMAKLQADYLQELGQLWQNTLSAKKPTLSDRRFADPAWQCLNNYWSLTNIF